VTTRPRITPCSALGGRSPNFRRCAVTGRVDRQYQAELDMLGVTDTDAKAAAAVDFECQEAARRRASRAGRKVEAMT